MTTPAHRPALSDKWFFAFYALLFILFAVAFAVPWRYFPYFSFYSDTMVVAAALSIIILTLCSMTLIRPTPRISLALLGFAVIWLVQPIFVDVIYISNNISVAILFVILALLSWVIQTVVTATSLPRVFAAVAWSLVIGAIIQAMSFVLQLWHVQGLEWILAIGAEGGQIGQRNLLAHYLMWGVAATIYLLSTGSKPHRWAAGLALVILLLSLGAVGSRSILLYCVAWIVLSIGCLTVYRHQLKQKLPYMLIFGTSIVILGLQALLPKIWHETQMPTIESGLQRAVSNQGDAYRLIEWQKSWQIFLENPVFGAGFDGYAYQSFLKDMAYTPKDMVQQSGFFTHAHNIFMQIMAEMGTVGLVALLLAMVMLLVPILLRLTEPVVFIIGSMIVVSLLHSLLEYPLWHLKFLTAFVLLLTLAQPIVNRTKPSNRTYSIVSKLSLGTSTLVLLYVFYVLGLNQYLINKYDQHAASDGVDFTNVRRDAMFVLGKKVPLLKMYYDQGVIVHMEPTQPTFSEQQLNAVSRVHKLRPVAYTLTMQSMIWYRQGQEQKAKELLQKSLYKDPRTIPDLYRDLYLNKDMFAGLLPEVEQVCLYYKELQLYDNYSKNSCVVQYVNDPHQITSR
ncbi:MAG: Wzy polymerase domain-containing protein [Moraxella sp.]|nr:Wzy polymerase domain-containing protein [Moraxella sp.]